jgi:fatty acid desaturase
VNGRGAQQGGRDPSQPRPPGEGWTILSYMIGGMALYGFVGWLAGRWTGWPVLFPIGMVRPGQCNRPHHLPGHQIVTLPTCRPVRPGSMPQGANG